jgi:hypothetical protein
MKYAYDPSLPITPGENYKLNLYGFPDGYELDSGEVIKTQAQAWNLLLDTYLIHFLLSRSGTLSSRKTTKRLDKVNALRWLLNVEGARLGGNAEFEGRFSERLAAEGIE